MRNTDDCPQQEMGVNKKILDLALPSILANITVPLVGMVDIAVAGHLDPSSVASAATLIGGVAIGTMLFDLLYWNFGFLRVGTGGLTAQAFGRGDMKESASILSRAVGIALLCSLLLLAVQWLFVKAAFLVVDCTPEVRELASGYFYIRIWASPATLSLMAFKGWFIGMQDSISPMVTDLVVNVVNTAASIVLALGFTAGGYSWEGIGFTGIAAGTVMAQYSGLLCAGILLLVELGLRQMDISSWISGNTGLMILLAAAIGLIPESGPHLIFVTLYASGIVPFPVLLASCISQDGHSSLPLLAESKKSFAIAKLLNFAVALAAGYASMLLA